MNIKTTTITASIALAVGTLLAVAPTEQAQAVITYNAACTAYTYKPYTAVRLIVTVNRDKTGGKYGYLAYNPRSNNPNGWNVKVWVNGKTTAYTTGNTVKLTAVATRNGRTEGLSCTAYLNAVA